MLERISNRTTRSERLAMLAAVVRRAAQSPAVQRFAQLACESTFSRAECALRILWFAQSRAYVAAPSGQWIQHDLEETLRAGGECGALATLVCAMAEVNGIPWQLVWRSYTGDGRQHVTSRLWVDGAWRWADATVRGASLGEDPNAAAARLRSPRGKRTEATP